MRVTLPKGTWKKVVVAGLVFAAGMYAGPVGGKAIGFLAPKVLDKVSDTPITDIKAGESPFKTQPEVRIIEIPMKPTLRDVATAWGIEGRLDCRVVQ